MTVKELIEELSHYNPNALITVGDNLYNGISISISGGDGCTKLDCEFVCFDESNKRENNESHPEEVINDDSENSSFNTVSNIETKHQPTENSNDEILRIFNKRRPYCPSDFKKHHFIEKLPKDI